MGILSWIVFGLIAGAIARFIMPGKDPGGFVVTIIVGIVGGVVGGFIGSLLNLGSVNSFDLRSLGLAVVGALVVLWGYRKLKK